MITGDLKNKVGRIWDEFWSGGISNPLEVIEQITYLLFMRRLDELQTLKEKKARHTGGVIVDPIFLPHQQHLRWGKLKQLEPADMLHRVRDEVFPFLQQLGTQVGGETTTYATHMREARFTIPTPALLAKVIDLVDEIPMENRDTNGDLYEYLLSKPIDATQQEIERYRLRPGDVLMTEGGDPDKLGRGAVWTGQIDPCLHQNHVFRVRMFHRSYGSPTYLSAYLQDRRARDYFLRSAKQTTGIASINMTQLRALPVPVAATRLQQQFEGRAEAVQLAKSRYREAAAVDDALFSSLQSRAFRGAL